MIGVSNPDERAGTTEAKLYIAPSARCQRARRRSAGCRVERRSVAIPVGLIFRNGFEGEPQRVSGGNLGSVP